MYGCGETEILICFWKDYMRAVKQYPVKLKINTSINPRFHLEVNPEATTTHVCREISIRIFILISIFVIVV